MKRHLTSIKPSIPDVYSVLPYKRTIILSLSGTIEPMEMTTEFSIS